MTQQNINLGTPPAALDGDSARAAFQKVQANFTELYGAGGSAANSAALNGLTGAADKAPYFTGAGAMSLATLTAFARTLLDDANAAAARTTLGLGTASIANVQTSPTDTTAGALMAVGAFGLGAGMQVTGAAPDSLTGPFNGGCFAGLSNGDAWSNNPYGGTNSNWWKIISCRMGAANYALQLAQPWSAANSGTLFVRSIEEGTLNPWRLLYSQSTIIGTVSQSGGVPTGALMQRVVTASGEVRRYADGFQICISPVLSLAYLNSGNLSVDWLFPAQFSSAPTVLPTLTGSFANMQPQPAALLRESNATISGASYLLTSNNGFTSGMSVPLKLVAVGRWFE